jgi:hypothetical protein
MIDFKTKICKGGAGRRTFTDQEQLASEQRRKELLHQTYLRNKEGRKKTYNTILTTHVEKLIR